MRRLEEEEERGASAGGGCVAVLFQVVRLLKRRTCNHDNINSRVRFRRESGCRAKNSGFLDLAIA